MVVESRWIAHHTQKQSNLYEPTAEDLIEKEEKSESNNQENSNDLNQEENADGAGNQNESKKNKDLSLSLFMIHHIFKAKLIQQIFFVYFFF